MAKKHRTKSKVRKKQKTPRGLFLSIWLGLMVLVNLITLALIMDRVRGTDVYFPYLLSMLFICTAAKIVAAIGIWFWEKWSLYVYAGAVLATIVIGLVLTGTWVFALNEVLPLAILGWLIRDKYANFA